MGRPVSQRMGTPNLPQRMGGGGGQLRNKGLQTPRWAPNGIVTPLWGTIHQISQIMGITKRIVAPGLSVNGGLPENGGAQSSKEWGTHLPENCGTQSRGDWCPHSLRELRAPSLPENVGLLENKDHPVSQRIGVSEWGNPEFQSVGTQSS